MQNSYISTPLAFSCKGTFCFSFNDYYFLNERIDKSCSSSLSSSCACSRFSTNGHGIPMNPRFLFGLRQSTLVQLSASRRLMILRGGGHYCPLPIYGFNRVCYGDAYRPPPPVITTTTTTTTTTTSNSSWRTRRRRGKREGRFDCRVWEEKSESWDSDIESDAEAMLSLLTEEIGEKFVGVGERKNRLAARRVQVEKRGRGVHECSRVEDKHVESDFLERNSKGNFESATIKSREEVYRSSVGKEGSLRGENHGLRKEGSSCSSYYSVLSSDGIDEKDVDVQVENGRFVGEFSTSHESKELRKEGEGVLAGKFRKQLKKYEDDDGEYGEVSTRRNSEMGSCAITTGGDWDSGNKVEKKITEVSVGQTESRKETSQNLYNVLDANESCARRASSSQKLFGGRENNSTLSMNLVEETKEQCSQTDHQVIQQSGSRKKAQQTTQRSEIHESEIERASISQTQSSGREKNLTASVNLVQEARQRHSQYDSRIKSQKLTKMSEINDLDIERASASRRVFETRMKNGEEKSTSLQSSVQEPNNRCTRTNQEVFGRSESRKESEDLTNISVICTSDTEAITDSQQLFETRMNARVGNSTLSANLVQEAKEGNQTHEGVIRQVGSRKEPQRPTKQSSFSVRSPKRASSSQSPLNLVPQSKEKQMGAWKEGINSQVMVTPPSSQFVARGSPETVHYRKPTSGYATQEVSRETLGSGSSTLYTEEEAPDSPHKLDGRTRIGVHSMLMFHEDALGSANRFDASSTQFVGEFTEKLQHEVSTSEGLKEMTSSPTTSVYKDETYTQQGSSQLLSEEFQSQVHGSRRTSSRSEVMGPSDEMWDVPGPSSQEPSRTDAPAPVEISPSTTSAIVRRSSRSLWSIIGDLVRLRWGARSETHNLTVKSGGKSSSNESVGSEAWFSGHEQDDKDDENVKKRRISKPKESISAEPPPYLGKAPAQIQAEASEAMSTQDTIIQIAADTSPSSGTVDYGSASKGASSASEKENFGRREDEKRGQISPSNILAAHSSSPLPTSRLISSPPVNEEISESSKAESSRSSFMEIVEQPITERPTKASGTEGKDGELKRRKLQRNKQFLQERFEEWEEAYKLESEQKKIDEMFMREALLEAKKAADTWEVPVGAVLVQHGKIIARGCNLVEQLRDSTAHAEMICIREASNLLRTWRLAETTLYVTLEPCPMCAGAILQARIDTVVWGAPNKLLGADGSWVRLFPGGGGGSGSDLTNQAAGPVHPFHPKMTIRRGILATECADTMQQFFQLRRKVKEKKQESPPPSCLPISTHQSKFLSKMHNIFNVMFCL